MIYSYRKGMLSVNQESWTPKSIENRSWGQRSTIFLRFCLGMLFLYAGWMKWQDADYFFASLMKYELFNANFVWQISQVFPAIEMLLGVWLMSGWLPFISALSGGSMILLFIVLLLSAWWRGLEIDCACFGSFQLGSTYFTWLLRNVLLECAFLWLSWRCRPRILVL